MRKQHKSRRIRRFNLINHLNCAIQLEMEEKEQRIEKMKEIKCKFCGGPWTYLCVPYHMSTFYAAWYFVRISGDSTTFFMCGSNKCKIAYMLNKV